MIKKKEDKERATWIDPTTGKRLKTRKKMKDNKIKVS